MNDHPEGGVGYLERREYNRFVWAWEQAGKIAAYLYSAGKINSGGETDIRVDSSSTPATPLDATWLAADEISGHLQALNSFHDAEHAASDKIGQYHAIELGRCVSAADHRWPMQDKPHHVRFLRCGGCLELTLTYRPPRWNGDNVKVDCGCGYSMDDIQWQRAIKLAEIELKGAA